MWTPVDLIINAIFGLVAFVLASAILAAVMIILVNLAREVGKAFRWPPK